MSQIQTFQHGSGVLSTAITSFVAAPLHLPRILLENRRAKLKQILKGLEYNARNKIRILKNTVMLTVMLSSVCLTVIS